MSADAFGSASATIVYPGSAGRASIELRILPDDSNEAYLIPSGAAPIPTGVSLIHEKGKYYIYCRKRKKRMLFKPEEAVQQTKRHLIVEAIEAAQSNYTEAAKRLGLHPNYLHRLIRNLNLREELRKHA